MAKKYKGLSFQEPKMRDMQKVYDSLDENEKFGLSAGLFPVKLMNLKLTNYESAKLIEISQKKSGVRL